MAEPATAIDVLAMAGIDTGGTGMAFEDARE